MIRKTQLEHLYRRRGKSMQEIADRVGCSMHKIQYWLDKYNIRRRSISEAIYVKHNPHGDPFRLRPPKNFKDAQLFGLGLGLYWGEGTKASKGSVRLGNTDPELIKSFMRFLIRIFGVKKSDFRFGLQIFSDIDINKARRFWVKKLGVSRNQFGKIIITKSGSIGTYRKKSVYGVTTLYYHNKKLRDFLVGLLPL